MNGPVNEQSHKTCTKAMAMALDALKWIKHTIAKATALDAPNQEPWIPHPRTAIHIKKLPLPSRFTELPSPHP